MRNNLAGIEAKWLQQCGACDAGIGSCSHPDADYRPTMSALVTEVEHLRAKLDEAQLSSIEARNPGIDMEEVKAYRARGEA